MKNQNRKENVYKEYLKVANEILNQKVKLKEKLNNKKKNINAPH